MSHSELAGTCQSICTLRSACISIQRLTNVTGAMVAAYSVPKISWSLGSSFESIASIHHTAKSCQPISLVKAFPLKLNLPRHSTNPELWLFVHHHLHRFSSRHNTSAPLCKSPSSGLTCLPDADPVLAQHSSPTMAETDAATPSSAIVRATKPVSETLLNEKV